MKTNNDVSKNTDKDIFLKITTNEDRNEGRAFIGKESKRSVMEKTMEQLEKGFENDHKIEIVYDLGEDFVDIFSLRSEDVYPSNREIYRKIEERNKQSLS
jgi:hypothetical protein